MKQKNISKTFILGTLIIFLITSLVLADDLVITSSPSTLTKSQNSSFSLTVSGNKTWSLSFPSTLNINDTHDNNARIIFSSSNPLNNLTSGSTIRINANVTSVDSGFNLIDSSQDIILTATNINNSSEQINKSVTLKFSKAYCENGAVGNSLDLQGVTDKELDNKNAWEWKPRDNIEIEVRVRNNNESDVTAVVAYGLYNTDTNDFLLENTQNVDVNSHSTETTTLDFQVPSKDLTADNYRFYVKVYDDSEGEDTQCADILPSGETFRTVNIKRDTHDISVEGVSIPSQLLCGQTADITMNVFNLGKNNENKVNITLSNPDLGLNQAVVINKLNKGDSKKITFSFLIPETAVAGSYPLTINAYSEYNSHSIDYGTSQTESTDKKIVLTGKCTVTADDLQLTLNPKTAIVSGGKAGESLVIKSTIVNLASRSATLTAKVTGYEDWAELQTIQPQTFTLPAGGTQDITYTFNVANDIQGDQNFTIQVFTSGNTPLKEQKVSIPITAPSSNSLFTGGAISGNLINKDNWYLWVLGILNVILVILIIVIAVRVARK